VKPPDLDRIRFVTRHFNELKGLTLVSSGLIFMSLGVPFLRRYSIVANLSIFGFRVALLAGGFVLTSYAKAYYQRIGEVQSLRTPVLRQEALSIYGPGSVPRARDATAEFNVSLLRITGLTKGNLSSHLSKLEEAGLVEIEKRFVGKKTPDPRAPDRRRARGARELLAGDGDAPRARRELAALHRARAGLRGRRLSLHRHAVPAGRHRGDAGSVSRSSSVKRKRPASTRTRRWWFFAR
jgi:DNA-binding transcriptional ArsR family regulator